ncbi:MAG: amino acid ABC transporter substrate-binding protein [Hyphomicrobiales bacterium]
MITRSVLFAICSLLSIAPARSEEPREIAIGYVDLADDPYYGETKGYAGLYTVDRRSPYPAAELAIQDSRAIGAALGVTFALVRKTLRSGEDVTAAVRTMIQQQHIIAAVIDLPRDQTEKSANALASEPLPLFNARHEDPALRPSTCRSRLFHTIPSQDMLTDALAQALLARNWSRVLVLEGQAPEDIAFSRSFQGSATKFGLTVSEIRPFVLGNDPRQRDQNNVRLLTGGVTYDTVFVADEGRQFAPYVPYNTFDPRPVIGSEGLIASAWHPFWERQGAPQLNRRFFRRNGRVMSDEDWATWAALRALVDAIVRMHGAGDRPLDQALLDPQSTIELYKGYQGSFRPWNRQLRQPILLGTADAVVGLAPVEGVLHEKNTLDSLGLDEPEFKCPQ